MLDRWLPDRWVPDQTIVFSRTALPDHHRGGRAPSARTAIDPHLRILFEQVQAQLVDARVVHAQPLAEVAVD